MIRIIPIIVSIVALHAASARVTWHANPETDLAGYRLQWSADGEPLCEIETSSTSAAVDDLKPGITYAFRLCAVNTSGMRSGWSDATSYTVPTSQRLRIVIYSSDSPSRDNKREEAILFQPITGPRRFWWAEITSP